MLKHNVLDDDEIYKAKKEISEIERSYPDDVWNSIENQDRQRAVSKGIVTRRRSIITLILEKYLSDEDREDLERVAYLCMLENEDIYKLDINVELKIT